VCLIVIPARDEERSLPIVLSEILRLVDADRVVVVDSFSVDKTAEVATSFGVRTIVAKYPGKAGAVFTAVKTFKEPCYIVMDADGEHPLAAVEKVYDLMRGGSDFVKTERVKLNRRSPYLIGNKVITFAFNMLFGTRFSDVLSGLVGFKRQYMPSQPPSPNCLEVTLLAKALLMNAKIDVVNYIPRDRLGGKKKVRLGAGLEILRCILKERFVR